MSRIHILAFVMMALIFSACGAGVGEPGSDIDDAGNIAVEGPEQDGVESVRAQSGESSENGFSGSSGQSPFPGVEPHAESGRSSDYEIPDHTPQTRDIDHVELTNLSNTLELRAYREGDPFQGLEITEVDVSQVAENGQWENTQVTVKFTGSLSLRGTLYYAQNGITSFVIGEDSYETAPAILVDRMDGTGTFPTIVYLDNPSIQNLLPGTEENFQKEAEIVFSQYDLVYGRYSSMSAMGIAEQITVRDEPAEVLRYQ